MENCTQISIAEWQQWKQEIKDRLNQTVENFIAIGYRLRQIQDTEAYRNDGYTSVYEFAQGEFGLSDSTTNRFMAINAKFTIDGKGLEMLPDFKGISYSKLQEMLTLSDEDCKLITVNTTVREIRELKNFNHDDENKYITPAGQQAERTPIQECIWDFFSQIGNKGLLEETIEALTRPDYGESMATVIADVISPAGNRTHRKGIVYLFMYDYDRGVAYKLMTSPMPIKITWRAFLEEVRQTYANYMAFEGSIWEAAYGSVPAEESESQIPGQMDITQVADVENEDKVDKKPEKKAESKNTSEFATSQEKEDVPQKAEKKPENVTEQSEIVSELPTIVSKQQETVSKTPETVINTECGEDLEDVTAAGVEESVLQEPLEDIWDRMHDTMHELHLFFRDYESETVPMDELQRAYKNALELAADFERMINNG